MCLSVFSDNLDLLFLLWKYKQEQPRQMRDKSVSTVISGLIKKLLMAVAVWVLLVEGGGSLRVTSVTRVLYVVPKPRVTETRALCNQLFSFHTSRSSLEFT